jgi:hypothetical protein
MRNPKSFLLSLGAVATLALAAAAPAWATADPTGCCCMVAAGVETCTETTEKDCLARQQAAPKYDEKTTYDEALKKSEAEEAGAMKSGWRAGKCPAK